jgi:hypothetical protein
MNDDQELAEVRRSFTAVLGSLDEVHFEHPSETVLARGDRRRLRRGLTGLAATGGALAIALALVLPSGGHPGRTAPAPQAAGTRPGGSQPALVHVNLAAWSVNQNADGLVLLQIHELKDAAALQHALASAGVPAVVKFGQSCSASQNRSAGGIVIAGPKGFEIRPSSIPRGWEMVFGIFPTSQPDTASFVFGLAPKGARLTCRG